LASQRGLIIRLGRAAVGVTVLVSGLTARAELPPGRELLATGDPVPGLGRIGTFGASVRGIADDGAVLLDLSLTDRTRALAWADGEQLRFIWRTADGGSPALAMREARVSADGRHVLVPGDPDLITGNGFSALYTIAEGQAHRLLAAGDRTLDGWTIAGISRLGGVANDGSAAVEAILKPPTGGDDFRVYLLSLSHAGARVLAGSSPLLDRSGALTATDIEPLATLAGGIVLFRASPDENVTGVFRGDAEGVEPLLTSADSAPDGQVWRVVHGTAASPNGELLVQACAIATAPGPRACTIYRSERGRWVTVRPASADGPDGALFVMTSGALNSRGDAVLAGYRADVGGNLVLSYPAHGAARVVGGKGYQLLGLNERGQVALRVPSGLARWSDGRSVVLATPQTTTADGARALAGGILLWCQADDGRVGAYVAVDGDTGSWLCIDDLGPHLMRRDAPDGEHCTFDDGAMIVAGPDRVTRSDGRRSTLRLAVGTPIGDRQRIDSISFVSVNPAGSLAAIVDSGERRLLVRVDPGGPPRVLDATAGGALDVYAIDAVQMADNGTVVALVSADYATTAVVAVAPDGATSVPFRDDSRGARVTGFEVAGNRLLLALEHSQAHPTMRLLDLETGEWTDRLPAGVLAPGELDYVVDTSRADDVLYRTFDDPSAFWILSGGMRRRLGVIQNEVPVPVALRAADDILFRTDTYTIGAERIVLSSTGGHIAGRCVAPQTAASSSDDDGCAIGERRAASAWPLLGAALCVGLAVRRRRRRSWT